MFCSLFSSIAIAWGIWILIVRSYGQKGILPWCYAPIAQSNSSQTQRIVEKHGFCTMIKHQLIHHREFLAKNKTGIMHQPSYSPGLGPAYFFLFPKLKTTFKGKRFATIEEMKEKSKQELLAILKSAFQKCFEDLKNR